MAPRDSNGWQDDGPLWAIPLALCILYWFRRGWVLPRLGLLSLLLGLSGCSPAVEGIWLTPDQQGRLRFDRGEYLTAAARFEDPRWKGLAYYAAQKWDLAAESFAAVDGPEGFFLLGNAYAQGGKLGSALGAYERALHLAPTDRKTRTNRDRVRRLVRSLQEDTDLESKKDPEQDHGDAETELAPDELTPKNDSAAPAQAADETAASHIVEEVWLARLTLDPTLFLRQKLALEAAREDQP